MLWVQQRVRNNDLDLYYVLGDRNPADIFTKPNIPQERTESLLSSMGCVFVAGRPESAPTLRKEGGTNVFSLRQLQSVSRHGSPLATGAAKLWADEEEALDHTCDSVASYTVVSSIRRLRSHQCIAMKSKWIWRSLKSGSVRTF